MVQKRCHPTHWHDPLRKMRAAAAVASTLRGRPLRVTVTGRSMVPSFEPGDRLLVIPVSRVRAGHVVALRDPRHHGRILVKRVRGVDGGDLDVRGDDPAASTDSRHFGTVPATAVVGRVLYRYHPPDRAGWVGE